MNTLSIPAPFATTVTMRFAPLTKRDSFDPDSWPSTPLQPLSAQPGYWQIDVAELALSDGDYEYEFILDDKTDSPVPDPYAEEIVRFGGYRGLFRIRDGVRWRWPFSWADELSSGVKLPDNNQIVIYEMPLRWMSSGPELIRQVGLGTFDQAIFAHLDQLADLGINTIELLPVQDSADTLNWGYGTRFFFTTDFDMGPPIDLKVFIKQCHQRGIRVFLDVVMNHARECPLEKLAFDWFFLNSPSEEPGRGQDWGARMFRYRKRFNGHYPAREFHYQMAQFWIEEYHIDGFRLDEFQSIDNWDFIQTFRERATVRSKQLFPDRPFLVIAEDSWRRSDIVYDKPGNPSGRKVVDSMWNFSYRDDIRQLMGNGIQTSWGQPSRRERIVAFISGRKTWNGLSQSFVGGFADLSQNVNYITSHDVEKPEEARFMNYLFGQLLRQKQLGDGSVDTIRTIVDTIAGQSEAIIATHAEALERVRSGFAILMTSVGIPMLLAGEEFGDIHDLDQTDYRLKMSDPVDWQRRTQPGHSDLWNAVRALIYLRTSHPALQRNEIEFFYFHPAIDQNDSTRVFAYCRTNGRPVGSEGQVVVVANCGPHNFAQFWLPWPWTNTSQIKEVGPPAKGTLPTFPFNANSANLSLGPYQVRVFTT
ncbi:alpha-amylase family glycosyl hydrolase [Spirosoma oryzicola]|uniref:alpha-amylase family glycosyl hydrolase n=1 Tax=Spirosoma oryzicola TaxID=2898794 RepID=UPI001E5ECB2E|nr:alpha-amylase family glycosyl hydrolase [Spirosoma oryzicola]UHG93067.1 hypothetical protein LQ777_09235 [Spirosoma oryzicola]